MSLEFLYDVGDKVMVKDIRLKPEDNICTIIHIDRSGQDSAPYLIDYPSFTLHKDFVTYNNLDPALIGTQAAWIQEFAIVGLAPGFNKVGQISEIKEVGFDGQVCDGCGNHSPMASKNMGDVFVCFSCRSSNAWKWK